MRTERVSAARHIVMRAGLAFVLTWFGIHELQDPGQWAVFVPSFVADASPVGINLLVLLHGFLLTVAGASVGLGIACRPGAILAVGLLTEVILGLIVDSGVSDLMVRDAGLLALAAALALDPVRVWHIDSVVGRAWPSPARQARGRAAKRGRLSPAPPASRWPQAGAAAILVSAVLALSVLLHATGSSGSAPSGSVALPAAASQATRAPAPPGNTPASAPPAAGTPAPQATPAPASSVRFDEWQWKPWSYQIYPGEPNADAKKALAGFQLIVDDQGDRALIKLKALSPRYRDSELYVDKGNTAYFVETSMRDDPADQENNLRDDGVIVVNPEGYILGR